MSTYFLYKLFNDNPLTRFVRGSWVKKWLNNRIPPQRTVVLNQKKIFIFPTWMGLAYVLTAFLLFLAGINYDNNLILNFSFLMASLFLVSILQTFSNLSGLVISASHSEPAFAGTEAKFTIKISKSREKQHHSIQCRWQEYESKPQNLVSAVACDVEMLLGTRKRGHFNPGRMRVQSVYPLGLCRAWTWVDLDMDCLVYPKPVTCELPSDVATQFEPGATVSREGNEDFDGLRPYRHSDSLRTVDWKSFARRGTLLSKQFHGYESNSVWIDWNDWVSADVELKLSYMCFWVLEMAKTNQDFGLKLPASQLAPGRGLVHQTQCLELLARF